MGKKIFGLFLLVALFVFPRAFKSNDVSPVKAESDVFITEDLGEDNIAIIGVNEAYKDELEFRIYATIDGKSVTTIGENAFVGCNYVQSVMISRSIIHINTNFLTSSSIVILYTGSLIEFNEIGYQTEARVYPYAYDEGFINLWNDTVDPHAVCDTSENEYRLLNMFYNDLGVMDRLSVDAYVFDESGPYTIKDGMNELKNLYEKVQPSSRSKDASQSATIVVVVVIAIIGMTSICVFYSFKDNELIS